MHTEHCSRFQKVVSREGTEMKLKIKVGLLVCAVICGANVGVTAAHLATVDKPPILSVDMGAGCAISVIDLYRGHLKSGMPANASYWTDTPPVRSSLGDFGINFECNAKQRSDDVANLYGARWDARRKRWTPYYENSDEQRLAAPVSRIYQLRSKNSTGFLRTIDQINGDESQRVRFYKFYLFHSGKSVCGDGQSRRLTEPSGDYLPYIMRVLQSVEFIDSPERSGGAKKP
jgi:hypothetical protein